MTPSRRLIARLILRATCALLLLPAAPGVHAQTAAFATLDRHGAWVAVQAYGPNIIHVTIAADKDEALKGPGYGILAEHADPAAFRWSGGADGDTYTSPALTLHVDPAPAPHVPGAMERYFAPQLAPVSLQVKNASGETVVAMTGWEMAPHTVNTEKTYQLGASFAAPADEHYYGMGQHQESTSALDLRGGTVDCAHRYDAPAGESVCVPFMVSSKGYAIVWDNPSATRLVAAIHGRTSFQSQVGERVSFFVIVAEHADALYSGYAYLTGKTPIPPRSAFGLIQSKARYASQDELLRVASTYREKGYPLDIMVLDWFYWTRMGQLDFNPAEFPDPDAMNRQLHAMGLQSMVSIWPRFETSSRYYNELDRLGYLLKDKDGKSIDGLPFRNDRAGALIDPSQPGARSWFWAHARDNILSHGFDYPWLDETEPDLVPDGYFYAIGSGDRYHNLFPLLHVENVADGLRAWRPRRRPLLLARAAYLGAQRSGALFWSSDINATWEALARQVPTGLNMTASGIAYWGNDIGGWQALSQTASTAGPVLLDPSDAREVVGQNNDYPELLTRWFEYGTFLPTLRLHGDRKHTEIWAYGREAEAILASYDQLRYRLIPYIYSSAKHTHDTGAPFMRALWMDFPADPRVANIGTEYMFGPAFLVAPVTEQGQTQKDVYLPVGADWYNYWTNEKFAGGRWIKVAAPISQIPLFVKAGSIVPLGAAILSTATRQAVAGVSVYPGRDGDFNLYDDDGTSMDYEKGIGATTTKLHWDDGAQRLSVRGGEPSLNKSLMAVVKVIGK